MPTDIVSQVARWTRSTNRRVMVEELLRAVAWTVTAGVVGLGLHRMPALLQRIHIEWPQWLPSEETMAMRRI